jgi:hypothetical protein
MALEISWQKGKFLLSEMFHTLECFQINVQIQEQDCKDL